MDTPFSTPAFPGQPGVLFGGRLAVLQRVLPAYRAPFFDLLASACRGGLSLAAGQPQPDESIAVASRLEVARLNPLRNLHFRSPSSSAYLCWQRGLLPWLEAWQPDALVVEANPRYLSTPRLVRWMHARGKPVLGWGLGTGAAGGGKAGWRGAGAASCSPSTACSLTAAAAQTSTLPRASHPSGCSWRSTPWLPAQRRPRPPARLPSPGVPSCFSSGACRPASASTCCSTPAPSCRRRCNRACGSWAMVRPAASCRSWQSIYPQAEFPGDQRGADLQPYFPAADLFALPGTGGLAVQEAMAAGLPVVVAEGDGTQDDLVRPDNGWQVPPGDVPALAAVLQQALSDPPACAAWAPNPTGWQLKKSILKRW